MKSPFLYPGSKGKKSDLEQISINIPKHDEYREPFVGGGSILFQCNHSWIGVISDVYEPLINCYTAMRDFPEEMLSLMPEWNPSPNAKDNHMDEKSYRDFWADWRKNKDVGDVPERAAKFLFLNRTSFQGMGGILKPEFQRYNYELMKGRVLEASKILAGIDIRNSTAFDVIKQKPKYDGMEVFMFVDPPYLQSNNDACYKGNKWTKDDFTMLATSLKESPHKWLLTIDDDKCVYELFGDFKILSFDWAKRQVNKKKQQCKELYVANYEIKVPEVKLEEPKRKNTSSKNAKPETGEREEAFPDEEESERLR